MIQKIKPTVNYYTIFKSKSENTKDESTKKENNNKLVVASLAGLAILGATTYGLIKTRTSTLNEALQKIGVEIKDNIAKKIGSEDLYTGKVERFKTRNRKEITEYKDGVIVESIEYNLLGKEKHAMLYKNGKLKYEIVIPETGKKRHYSCYEYTDDSIIMRGHGLDKDGTLIQRYRELINKN